MPFPDLTLFTNVLAGPGAVLLYAAEGTGIPDNGDNVIGLPFVAAGVPPDLIDASRIKVYVEFDPGRPSGGSLAPGVTDCRFVSLSADKTELTLNFAQSGVGTARVTVELNHTITAVGSDTDPVMILSDQAGSGSDTSLIRQYAPGVVVNDVVYQRADDLVDKADASAAATGVPLGVVSAIDSPAAGQCRVLQFGDRTGFAGLTPGETYIVSTTPGALVGLADTANPIYPDQTPGSGHVIAPVGVGGPAGTTLAVNVGAGITFEY